MVGWHPTVLLLLLALPPRAAGATATSTTPGSSERAWDGQVERAQEQGYPRALAHEEPPVFGPDRRPEAMAIQVGFELAAGGHHVLWGSPLRDGWQPSGWSTQWQPRMRLQLFDFVGLVGELDLASPEVPTSVVGSQAGDVVPAGIAGRFGAGLGLDATLARLYGLQLYGQAGYSWYHHSMFLSTAGAVYGEASDLQKVVQSGAGGFLRLGARCVLAGEDVAPLTAFLELGLAQVSRDSAEFVPLGEASTDLPDRVSRVLSSEAGITEGRVTFGLGWAVSDRALARYRGVSNPR